MSSTQSQTQTQTQTKAPPTASEIYHALLRPAILQILRAQGYYSSTAGTVDTLTELAGSYMAVIAGQTARHAGQNNDFSPCPTIVDVRMALEDCGALLPQRDIAAPGLGYEEEEEDTRGVDDFINWAKGKKNQRIRKVAGLHRPVVVGEENEAEERETDYLSGMYPPSVYSGIFLPRPSCLGTSCQLGGSRKALRSGRRRNSRLTKICFPSLTQHSRRSTTDPTRTPSTPARS